MEFVNFSPDGRLVAYTSTGTGQYEVSVRSYPDGERVGQVSVDFGIEPIWCDTCGELFYRKGSQWFASQVTLGDELSWEPPRLAFETTFIDTPGISYDISPDGQRLLVVKRTREPETNKLHVIHNWAAELERLVPTNN